MMRLTVEFSTGIALEIFNKFGSYLIVNITSPLQNQPLNALFGVNESYWTLKFVVHIVTTVM
jgi:hypothetical protein